MINKTEFNRIKERILAQVTDVAKPMVESDLLTLWYEITALTGSEVKHG